MGVAELSLTWGDELMRSRFRQSQRKDPHTTLPDNMIPYLKDFVDQRKQDQEDFGIELSTAEEESLLFAAHLKCTHITLVGHTKEGLPLSPPTEGVASTMSSPRRIWTVEPKHLLLWTTPTSAGGMKSYSFCTWTAVCVGVCMLKRLCMCRCLHAEEVVLVWMFAC